MTRTIAALLIALGAMLGLTGTAQAYEPPAPSEVAATLEGALATGWSPAAWDGRTDTIGRPSVHVLYGSDYGSDEDVVGWDCRVQGNRDCGTVELHQALDACHLYAEYLSTTVMDATDGDEGYFIQCATVAYLGQDAGDPLYATGQWHAAWAAATLHVWVS